jgi:sporulation protein YlmC with PRC-barrel domain
MRTVVAVSLLCVLALCASNVTAQNQADKAQKQTAAENQSTKSAGENIKAEHVFRTSKLSGMDVKNHKGENLGEIKELVIDVETGKVKYAALSFGGVFGIGDKLFAVPWNALTLKHSEDDQHFVLPFEKERLKTAKGFDQSRWPDVANPQWAAETESFYETATKTSEQERKRR